MSVSDRLTLPSRTTAIDDARRWASGHLERAGASAEAVWAVELVLTEALSNIVRHAYGGDEGQVIELELDLDDERVELVIVHFGEPFDPSTYSPPDLDAVPTGGYGVLLINELMDEVRRETTADRGTRVTLVKRRWREQA